MSEHTEGSRSPGSDNEDPRDREIQQLAAKIKRLREVYRRNHAEIHFIPPVSFGELDHDTPSRPSARHRFKAEPQENGVLRNRIKFHEFCGMSVKQLQRLELIVEFNSSHHGKYLPESYCMALQTNDQGIFSVKRAYLPPSINLKDALKHISPNNGDNLKEFLRYIQRCVSAYLFRTADLENLKKVIADSSIKSVQVDGSLNSLCLFMEFPLTNITNKATVTISTMLEYEPDSFLPTGFTIDSDINNKAKKEAKLLLVDFINLPLSEAYTSLVIKNILSSDESCDNGGVGDEDIIEQAREVATSETGSASDSSNESDQNTLINKQVNKNNKRLNKSVGNKPQTLRFTSKRKKPVEIDQEEEYKSENNEKEVNKLVNKKHKTDQNTSEDDTIEDIQRSVSNKTAKKNRTNQKSARIQSEEFDLGEEDESEDNQSWESNKSAEKKDESEDSQSEESNKSAEKKDDQRSVSYKAAEKKNRTDQKKSMRIQSEEFDLGEEDESEDNQSEESNNKSAEKKDDQRSVSNKAAEKKNRTDQRKSMRIQSEEFDLGEEDESEDNQSEESNKSAEKKVIVSGKDQSKMLKGKERESVGLKERKNVSENKLTEESDLDSVATADLIRWTESNFSPTTQGRKDETESTPKSTRTTGRGKGVGRKRATGRGKRVGTKQATIKMFFNK